MKKLLNLSLLTLCLFLLSSCSYGIKEYTEIENKDSSLLGVLVTRSDLGKGWQWKETMTLQHATAAEESSGLEYANRELIGEYQNHLLIIEHEVYCYDQNHPVDTEKRDYKNGDLKVQEVVLNGSSNIIYAQCREFSDTLHKCHALSKYSDVISDIEIRSPKEVDYSILMSTLNLLNSATDERISANPVCGK